MSNLIGRLMQSRVCVLGLSSITTEISKNLVLKAVNIDFFDSRVLSEEEASGSFLFCSEDVGKNVSFLALFGLVFG